MIEKELEFAFIRNEKDNQFTIFFKFEHSFLEKELDININGNNQLVINIENKLLLITKILPQDILDSLLNKQTLAIFTDNEANFIAQETLEPLKKIIKKLKNKL